MPFSSPMWVNTRPTNPAAAAVEPLLLHAMRPFHLGSRRSSNVRGSGGNQAYVYHIPNLLPQHVQQHARAKANEHARHELNLDAEVVGDPTIDIAMDLRLTGTTYFDQSYQMDHIHHEFGMSGHVMTITARAAKQGRSAS